MDLSSAPLPLCERCGDILVGANCPACGAWGPALVTSGGSVASGGKALAPPALGGFVGQEPGRTSRARASADRLTTCPRCGARGLDPASCGNCGARLAGHEPRDARPVVPDTATASSFSRPGGHSSSEVGPVVGVRSGEWTAATLTIHLTQMLARADKGAIREAALRTAGAWAAVWLLVVTGTSVVALACGLGVVEAQSQGAGLLLMSLGSRGTVFLAESLPVAGGRIALLTLPLLLFMALRLSQVFRRPERVGKAYLTTSVLTSAAAVMVLAVVGSSPAGLSLSWSWPLPMLAAMALALIAVRGSVAPERFSDLRASLAVLGHLGIAMLWIALAAGFALGLVRGLSTGAEGGSGGVAGVLGYCTWIVLSLPNIAIAILAKILWVPLRPEAIGDFGDLYSAGRTGDSFSWELTTWSALVPWLAPVAGIVLLSLGACWLTSASRLVESRRLWMWMGMTFALAGFIAARASEMVFSGPSPYSSPSVALLQIDALSLAWRLGIVGMVLGLSTHPAVLPTVIRWRQSMPTAKYPLLAAPRSAEVRDDFVALQPIMTESGRAIGRSAQHLVWGVVAVFMIAVLAVPAGKLLETATNSAVQHLAEPVGARSTVVGAQQVGTAEPDHLVSVHPTRSLQDL